MQHPEMMARRYFTDIVLVGVPGKVAVDDSVYEFKTIDGEIFEPQFYLVEKTSHRGTLRVAGSESTRGDFVGYLNTLVGSGRVIILNHV